MTNMTNMTRNEGKEGRGKQITITTQYRSFSFYIYTLPANAC